MEKNTQVETRVQNEVGIIDIVGEVTSFSEKILEEAYEKLTADGIKKIGFNFNILRLFNAFFYLAARYFAKPFSRIFGLFYSKAERNR